MSNYICDFCGYSGTPKYNDGNYCCPICGAVMKTSAVQSTQASSFTNNSASPVCPICKNADNNVFKDGKCYCALCSSEIPFVPSAPSYDQQHMSNQSYNNNYLNKDLLLQRKKELENQKSNSIIAGAIFIFLFWPVSIYFFYKASKLSKQIDALGV